MTNGEKLQEVFPNIEIVAIVPNEIVVIKNLDGTDTYSRISFRYEWWYAEYKEPTTKNNLGVDYISRADARSLICKIDIKHHMFGMSRKVFKDLYNGMDELPSVTPQEPRKGHWVHGEYCSECGCDVPAYIIDWKWKKDMNAKYCPNCGAKMEVKE